MRHANVKVTFTHLARAASGDLEGAVEGSRALTAASAQRPAGDHEPDPLGGWSLLVRLNLTTAELASYRYYAPAATTRARLIVVAARRWSSDESFQGGKGLAGPDERQVRGWTQWRR
jgi:hypothetical protein